VTAKAAALAYSLALNHPFIDGNKRVAHVAMEVFLALNGLPTFMPMLTNRKRYSSILPQAGRAAQSWNAGLAVAPLCESADQPPDVLPRTGGTRRI
jgi:hypothetical protein